MAVATDVAVVPVLALAPRRPKLRRRGPSRFIRRNDQPIQIVFVFALYSGDSEKFSITPPRLVTFRANRSVQYR